MNKHNRNSFEVRRATIEDVDAIFRLTSEMAEKGLMLRRSKYKIITMLPGFFVAQGEAHSILGCGAFIPLWTDMGEIMALAVRPDMQGSGAGKQLVGFLIEEGLRMKVPEIITLTYQVDFFSKLGFTITDKDRFPRKLWGECLDCPKLEECDETAMSLILG